MDLGSLDQVDSLAGGSASSLIQWSESSPRESFWHPLTPGILVGSEKLMGSISGFSHLWGKAWFNSLVWDKDITSTWRVFWSGCYLLGIAWPNPCLGGGPLQIPALWAQMRAARGWGELLQAFGTVGRYLKTPDLEDPRVSYFLSWKPDS